MYSRTFLKQIRIPLSVWPSRLLDLTLIAASVFILQKIKHKESGLHPEH